MSGKEKDEMTVHIKYQNLEKIFVGSPNTVWHGINKFFCETIPVFDIARKLSLTIDIQKLAESVEGVVALTSEGPRVLVSKEKLTDNEILVLNLLAIYLGFRLGLLKRDSTAKEELQARLGKSGKITNTRLGELVRKDIIVKTQDGDYRITALGIKYLQEELLPRIRAKTA